MLSSRPTDYAIGLLDFSNIVVSKTVYTLKMRHQKLIQN